MSSTDADQPVFQASDDVQVVDGLLPPTLVRASAGTGKTYQLTARLLRILLQGAAPETILATTFTRKAAGEILHRVLLTLAKAADEDDTAALDAMRQQVGIDSLPPSVCLQLTETLLSNIHRLKICTLDSLFTQLAQSFPFELGLPPAWRLTDEIEEAWLRERAVDAMISELDRTEMTSLMSMLGKGETRRSVTRELLGVVNDAYGRQRQCDSDVWGKLKAPKLPDETALNQAMEAFRSVKPKQKRHQDKLKAFIEILERRDFAAIVDDTLVRNIAEARRTGDAIKYYRAAFPDGIDDAFDVLYRAAQSTTLTLLRAQNQGTGSVLESYDHHTTQLKLISRVLSFDDVGVRLAEHFSKLDFRDLHNRMDGAIDHVLLDEFQDTSPVQWQVLHPLASRAAAYKPDPDATSEELSIQRSFFCVGDTKQAIYGWRGGVAEIFDAVADQLPDVVELQQNKSYRSSPVIMDSINEMFENLPRHPLTSSAGSNDLGDKSMHEARAVMQFSRRFPTHESAKPELPGYVRLKTSRIAKGADSAQKRMSCFEEAARQVLEIHESSPNASIGVLTRTNQAVAQMIFLLEQLDVEVSQEGGNPLTDSAAVEMVLSALMMAEHPGDGRWAFHLSDSPLMQIEAFGPEMVRAMTEDRGLAETVEFLASHLAPICDARETLRLKQLCHLTLGYQSQSASRIRDFVRMVREKRVDRPQAARVRVMTIHQSKGLEFDAVVLAELDGQLTRQAGNCVADVRELGEPPQAMSRYLNQKSWHYLSRDWQKAFGKQAAASMTESLCLLYVAMTRARQALYMIMTPATKKDFTSRTSASLIFHALSPDSDPKSGGEIMYQAGDENWHRQDGDPAPVSRSSRSTPSRPIVFQAMPQVPNRNAESPASTPAKNLAGA